jgi:hypothetical protein
VTSAQASDAQASDAQASDARATARSPAPRAWATALALAAGLATLAVPRSVHAYLDGRSFEDEAIRGGGGGRFFTGAPRDGYVCSVCHDGGEPLPLRVEGIPAEGWEPGRTYVLTIPFTDGARNVGAAIEVADERGTGVGTFDGLASADTRPEDLCRGPAPGEPGPPAARGLSLEGRTVARADVCGARRLAVRWTAPPAPVTSVRVFASLVAADDSGDPSGDASGHVALALRARGEPNLENGRLGGGCAVGAGRGGWLPLLALGGVLLRRSRRARSGRRA